jgi:hypothetical protein
MDEQIRPVTLGEKAARWLHDVADMLLEKGKSYGDSAGNPIRVFTDASPIDMLLIRAEDKLSRLVRGSAGQEDTVKDLVGYLALLAAAGWKGKNQ